jgi:hypothetical protein
MCDATLLIIVLYLVAGLLAAWVVNYEFEREGKPKISFVETLVVAVTWPMMLFFGLVAFLVSPEDL